MGWTFVILGLVTIAVGTFMIYYGQDLLRRPMQSVPVRAEMLILSPGQERLLELLAKYQKMFAANKLVVSRRKGTLHFDGKPEKGKGISLLHDLYGVDESDESRASEFEKLMESIPLDYLRLYGEARLDNPFVVSVTNKGMKYLRTN